MTGATLRLGLIGAAHPHVLQILQQVQAALGDVLEFTGLALSDRASMTTLTRAVLQRIDHSSATEKQAVLARSDVVLCADLPSIRGQDARLALAHDCHVWLLKPAFTDFTTLDHFADDLAARQRQALIFYTEHLFSPATQQAMAWVEAGAIGSVVAIQGLGPHRLNEAQRPPWFFDVQQAGSLITDLLPHQIDQVLRLMPGDWEVRFAQQCNRAHPHHCGWFDVADVMLASDRCQAHLSASWLAPAGLPSWGDIRLQIQGTDGMIEVRKTLDYGRSGSERVVLVDQQGVRMLDCAGAHGEFKAALRRWCETACVLPKVSNESGVSGSLLGRLIDTPRALQACRLALQAEQFAAGAG